MATIDDWKQFLIPNPDLSLNDPSLRDYCLLSSYIFLDRRLKHMSYIFYMEPCLA